MLKGEDVKRLWERDPAQYSADVAAQESIEKSLGWLNDPREFLKHKQWIDEFAHSVRDDGFKRVYLLGMGGSSLGAEVFWRTFGAAEGWPELTILDTTDPEVIREAAGRSLGEKSFFLVASKSGTTLEALSLLDFFSGQHPGDSFAAITDPGTPLADRAKKHCFRKVFLNPPDVGGRFSVLTFFGLVPAALLGLDLERILESAGKMWEACRGEENNPGLDLANAIIKAHGEGKDKLLFPASTFSDWAEQLVAESTGKWDTGILPVVLPDRFMPKELRGDLFQAPVKIHRMDDLPAEFFRWEFATALLGIHLEINPFDQPDVEAAKRMSRDLLKAWEETGKFPGEPTAGDANVDLYSSVPGGGVMEILMTHLTQWGEGEYLSILSYLPQTADSRQTHRDLVAGLWEKFKVPVTLGWGPRYLHSTGQYHKGGPDRGKFVILTCEQDELEIQGRPFGFATLKQAQAAGDYEALAGKGRRVVRVHFKGNWERTIGNLISFLGGG